MRILQINKFFFPFGGVETYFFSVCRLLQRHGHEIIHFSMQHKNNLPSAETPYFLPWIDLEKPMALGKRLAAAGRILYSFAARRHLQRLLVDRKPDIAHLHGIYHQISPSILHTLKEHRIPVVMTLHDYKMVCPTYTLMSGGRPCEKCRRRRFHWCLLKKCTKNSIAKSLLNTCEMILHHRLLHIYRHVDVFICPSRFLMEKVREMGFGGTLVHLPNFSDLEKPTPGMEGTEKSLLFFGRLVVEKGLTTLLDALQGTDIACRIIGDGPLRPLLAARAGQPGLRGVSLAAHLPFTELQAEIRRCRAVVLPSIWYENNPLSILEAYTLGKPVIAARIGGIPELVKEGETGFTFEPGNSADLRQKITMLLSDPEPAERMGRKARRLAEEQYTPNVHYEGLLAIYRRVTAAQRENDFS